MCKTGAKYSHKVGKIAQTGYGESHESSINTYSPITWVKITMDGNKYEGSNPYSQQRLDCPAKEQFLAKTGAKRNEYYFFFTKAKVTNYSGVFFFSSLEKRSGYQPFGTKTEEGSEYYPSAKLDQDINPCPENYFKRKITKKPKNSPAYKWKSKECKKRSPKNSFSH